MNKKVGAFSFDNANESTGFLLWQLTNLWQREIRKSLEPYDLTHSQFVLLASTLWLTLQNEEVTQIALSQHTKIDPMTTSSVLRTLQNKQLISRMEHKTDTRAKLVVLTEKGNSLVAKAIQTVENFDRDFFSGLNSNLGEFNKHIIQLLQNPMS